MARRDNKIKNYKILYIVGILFIIIVIAISLNSKKRINSEGISNVEKTEEEIVADKNQKLIAQLQTMEERDRMEYYFGIFIENIENGRYETAYQLLYEDFRKNYFPTLESFEEYIPTIFSEMINIEHENIERNGDVYVLWVYITDAINGKPDQKKEMNVVIQENDYNDFVLSFSVI